MTDIDQEDDQEDDYDLDDRDDDRGPWDWYDDEPYREPTEPNCMSCYDSGGPCCEPTRLQILLYRLRWWWWRFVFRLRHRRPLDDEPPF